MHFDLPQELPRRRTSEVPRSAPALEASPIERREEHLAARAEDHRNSGVHRRTMQDRSLRHQGSREPNRPTVTRDRQVDQRTRRQAIPQQVAGLSLREEERKVLAEVGRFRVISTRDLAATIYDNRRSRMERDLAFLRKKGFVEVDAVNARRDGRGGRVERIEVVTLTKSGQDIARQISGLPDDQRLYAGLVKPREAEHDAQIYRAYRQEAERIEREGGKNLRVRLDFELKSIIQKAIHAARKAEPDRGMAEIKQQVAGEFDLPFVNHGIQIPDARIEYDVDRKAGQDMDQGSGCQDIEVLTAAYRPGHLRSKAQAGFRVYASSSNGTTLTAKIENGHYRMESIPEL